MSVLDATLEFSAVNRPDKISVIVPCRNEKRSIRDFLDSVLAQELEPGWVLEILVADGMSDDGTREVLANYAAQAGNVRVIDNPGRIVSTGLNAAIASSTGGIIVRMDAHTTYAPDYIRRCVNTLLETRAENVGGPWVCQGQGPLGQAVAAAFQSPFCMGGGKAHDPHYEGEVDTVYLGCWPRSVFERFGLFDQALVRNQDDEFNFRLRRMGGRIWQSPRIRSSYTPRASLKRLFLQYLQYGFWRVAVIRKHRSLASWRHTVPALFVSWIFLSVALILLAYGFKFAPVGQIISAALIDSLLIYFCACLVAALPFVRSVHPLGVLMLPGVIAVHHFAYGLGFLAAVLKGRSHRRPQTTPGPLFTALTR